MMLFFVFQPALDKVQHAREGRRRVRNNAAGRDNGPEIQRRGRPQIPPEFAMS